jgi:hypothetical protein
MCFYGILRRSKCIYEVIDTICSSQCYVSRNSCKCKYCNLNSPCERGTTFILFLSHSSILTFSLSLSFTLLFTLSYTLTLPFLQSHTLSLFYTPALPPLQSHSSSLTVSLSLCKPTHPECMSLELCQQSLNYVNFYQQKRPRLRVVFY